jgi:hypothetical protein
MGKSIDPGEPEYILATKNGGRTWEIFLSMDDWCARVAILKCRIEVAEEIVQALNYVLAHEWMNISGSAMITDPSAWN